MTDLLTRTTVRLPVAPVEAPLDADAHAGCLESTVAAELAMTVAPSTGRFRPAVDPGSAVSEGLLVGHVTGGAGRADAVYAPVAGVVAALLVRPGQLVNKGRGLVWLQRSAALASA
ncbi:hypothetical protein BH23ACT8_BH23ACT8_07520 [soil metagenome]